MDMPTSKRFYMNYFTMPGLKKELFSKRTKLELISSFKYQESRIIKAVCNYFDTDFEKLIQRKRNREIVIPRQLCQYLLMNKGYIPCTRVGKIFNQDHSTVLHSCNSIGNLINADYENECKQHYNNLLNLI